MHKKRQKPIRTKMIYSSQLDRLKKDSLELKEYIRSVEKEGLLIQNLVVNQKQKWYPVLQIFNVPFHLEL